MSEPTSGGWPLSESDEGTRILRSLLVALSSTPLLFANEQTRRIVSVEATVAAVVLGVLLGVVAAIGLADVDLEHVDGVAASLVALAAIAVVTVVLWVVVPHRYLGTVIQFAVVFMWTMPVTELLYHRHRSSDPH